MKKLSKKKIIIIFLVIILLIGSVSGYKYYQYKTGFNLSDSEKESNIEKLVKKDKGYFDARNLTYAYFGHDTDKSESIVEEIDECENKGYDNFKQAYDSIKDRKGKEQKEKELKELEQKILAEKPKVSDMQITKQDFIIKQGSNYGDVTIVVKNNGKKEVNYIRVDIVFYDENNQVIQSEWTNDNSTIMSGASQTLTKMVRYSPSIKKYKCVVSEVN